MTQSQQDFTAGHYAPRAENYVTSAVHSAGADLDQVEAALKGRRDARVLDLGCGGGHVSYRAAPHVAEVVACDVTESMLSVVARTAEERGLKNIRTRNAPAERLPFEDGFFDIVLCRFTTHHWQNMEAGLREARRVLKSGAPAWFIDVIAPADPVLDTHLQTIELLRDVSHVRNYSVAEWVAGFQRSGFRLDGLTTRRLRMEFPVWIARTKASALHAEAIQSLQAGASPVVKQHFDIAEDGSFDLESTTFELRTV
jgi:SAM-dependent methyltransferase